MQEGGPVLIQVGKAGAVTDAAGFGTLKAFGRKTCQRRPHPGDPGAQTGQIGRRIGQHRHRLARQRKGHTQGKAASRGHLLPGGEHVRGQPRRQHGVPVAQLARQALAAVKVMQEDRDRGSVEVGVSFIDKVTLLWDLNFADS
jgi:hypothetical protein